MDSLYFYQKSGTGLKVHGFNPRTQDTEVGKSL